MPTAPPEFFSPFQPALIEPHSTIDTGVNSDAVVDSRLFPEPPIVARVNEISNPSFETNANKWFTGNAATEAVSTLAAWTGTQSFRVTATGTGRLGVYAQGFAASNRMPVSAGTTYSFSLYVRPDTSAEDIDVEIDWFTSGGTYLSTSIGSAVTCASGSFTRLTVTGTAPVGAAIATPYMQTVNWPTTGNVFYVDGALFENSPTVGSYFDGSTSGASWTGTAHGSFSVLIPTPGGGSFNGSATSSLAFSITATGVVSRSATASVSESFAVTTTGVVGSSKTASVNESFTVTASGTVGKEATSTVALGFAITATGTVGGAGVTADVPLSFAVTTTGVVDRSATASVPLAVSITATGVVGKAATGTVPLAVATTATGVVGKRATASVSEAVTITATGALGKSGSASVPLGFTITATGSVGAATAVQATASLSASFSITAEGSLSVAIYKFSTPVNSLHKRGRKVDNPTWYMSQDFGQTIYRTGGVWASGQDLPQEVIDAADLVYRGGYTYTLTPAERDVLVAAGFGSGIYTEYVTIS